MLIAGCWHGQEYLSLPAGSWTFQARATDLAGNLEGTGAPSRPSKFWTVALPASYAIITGENKAQSVTANITTYRPCQASLPAITGSHVHSGTFSALNLALPLPGLLLLLVKAPAVMLHNLTQTAQGYGIGLLGLCATPGSG